MHRSKFFEGQRRWLKYRRESKSAILKQGGEQALSHSLQDIVRIDFALKRIEEGQYGLCTDCGCPIHEGRLKIVPETPFCASCATRIESQ